MGRFARDTQDALAMASPETLRLIENAMRGALGLKPLDSGPAGMKHKPGAGHRYYEQLMAGKSMKQVYREAGLSSHATVSVALKRAGLPSVREINAARQRQSRG